MLITQERLKELLHYSPETGEFTWRIRPHNRIKVGARAGHLDVWGYIDLKIARHHYKAHRLAWLYVHGEWPLKPLDHINQDKSDNRIANLRSVPPVINMRNRPLMRTNKTGINGVRREGERWHAFIKLAGRTHNLGRFATKEEAHAARLAGERTIWGTA